MPIKYTIEQLNLLRSDGIIAIRYTSEIKQYKSTYFNVLECKCFCGMIFKCAVNRFTKSSPKSCGCKRKKWNLPSQFRYHKLRGVYSFMIRRCYDPTFNGYKIYGAKGIIVCDEWKTNPLAFIEWGIKNGYREGLELDKDIKGDGKLYSPETCCFVDPTTNVSNRKCSVKYLYEGQLLTLSQIAKLTGIKYIRLKSRIYRGNKTIEEALNMGTGRDNHSSLK